MALSFGILLGVGRSAPIALSALAHVAVAGALIATAAGHARVAPDPLAEVTLETVDSVVAPVPVPEPEALPVPNVAAKAAAQAPPTHTHDYPVPEDHDAHPHDPSLHHDHAEAPALAAPALTSDAPMPRFTIAIGAAPEAHGAVGATALVATPVVASGDITTYADAQVSRRATLSASAVAVYPAQARAGELEADVPLEIVVDQTGNVIDARIVTPAGSGFDESALTAIRRYRFTPATRDGKPVRVRMRWSVQFRLR